MGLPVVLWKKKPRIDDDVPLISDAAVSAQNEDALRGTMGLSGGFGVALPLTQAAITLICCPVGRDVWYECSR